MTISAVIINLSLYKGVEYKKYGFDNLMQYLSINDKMAVKLIPLSSHFPHKMKTWILLLDALRLYSSVSKLYDVKYDWRQFRTF